jgi:hypothetical protein
MRQEIRQNVSPDRINRPSSRHLWGSLFGAMLCLSCRSEAPVGQKDPTLTLRGPNVVRKPTPPYFREVERYVLQGERVGQGCRFRGRGGPGLADWGVEVDFTRCIQIRARGHVVGPIPDPGPAKGQRSEVQSVSIPSP